MMHHPLGDVSCSAHSSVCSSANVLLTQRIGNDIVVDTVRFPAERNHTLDNLAMSDVNEVGASGVAVCYAGLFRGFGSERSGALNNHAKYLLQPLLELFPSEVFVAFSTAVDLASQAVEATMLAPRVHTTLRRIGIVESRVIEEPRPVNNGSNYMQLLSFGAIEHCGRLIRRLRSRRAQDRPFAYAVRIRYDLLIEPRVGGAMLPSWPIWKSSSSYHTSSPLLTLSKYIIENSTSTRGLQLHGCPWQLPVKRCVPQDVFFIARASPLLLGPGADGSIQQPVEGVFLHSHSHVKWWLTEGLKARMHASERTLFDPLLSRGVPIDILWLDGGHCAWMLVDERGLGDARAPRAVFRGRCTRLRTNASMDAEAKVARIEEGEEGGGADGSGGSRMLGSGLIASSRMSGKPGASDMFGIGGWEEQTAATEQRRISGEELAVAQWHLSPQSRAAREAACASESERSARNSDDIAGILSGSGGNDDPSVHHSRPHRIAWLHIPKCGSSFGTALFHLANASLPATASMPTCAHTGVMIKPEMPRPHFHCVPSVDQCTKREVEKCVLGQPELSFFARFPIDEWFRCTFWEKRHGNVGGHEPLDEATYEAFRGHLYGMFREPTKRTVSSYLWYQSEFHHDPPLPNATTYAMRARGTQTKMVAGQVDGEACNSGYRYWSRCDTSIVPDLELAIRRLSVGFAFVGLTDQWALSICLLHSIHRGGRCLRVEFENTRPTTSRLTRLPWIRNMSMAAYSTATMAEVRSVRDPYDEALYAAAVRRFYADVERHQLSKERCEALCPDAPPQAFVNARYHYART